MLRITRLSLSTGWYKKIRITLSTVALSVNIKTTSKCSLYFDVLATKQVTGDDSMFATGENESLFKV